MYSFLSVLILVPYFTEIMKTKNLLKISMSHTRVLEPACFRAAPGIFFIRSRLRLLVKDNKILKFCLTDYKLSKIRSNTCTSTSRPYFMFTIEKTSNDVKFHVIFVNYYVQQPTCNRIIVAMLNRDIKIIKSNILWPNLYISKAVYFQF